MNRRLFRFENVLITILLLISLFIYLFYRPECILVNKMLASVIGDNTYWHWKEVINTNISLPNWVIYNLPEALWTFCITICSAVIKIHFLGKKISLIFLPLIFVIGLEMLQYLHFTNGVFDIWDIILGVIAWMLGYIYTNRRPHNNSKKLYFNFYVPRFIFSYLIVFLAHWLY